MYQGITNPQHIIIRFPGGCSTRTKATTKIIRITLLVLRLALWYNPPPPMIILDVTTVPLTQTKTQINTKGKFIEKTMKLKPNSTTDTFKIFSQHFGPFPRPLLCLAQAVVAGNSAATTILLELRYNRGSGFSCDKCPPGWQSGCRCAKSWVGSNNNVGQVSRPEGKNNKRVVRLTSHHKKSLNYRWRVIHTQHTSNTTVENHTQSPVPGSAQY